MIYGINNKSLADVEGPGEEPGCGSGGIISLLGQKEIKKVYYFPKSTIRVQMSSCSLYPMDWQHISNTHLADGMRCSLQWSASPAAVQPHHQPTQVTRVWWAPVSASLEEGINTPLCLSRISHLQPSAFNSHPLERDKQAASLLLSSKFLLQFLFPCLVSYDFPHWVDWLQYLTLSASIFVVF